MSLLLLTHLSPLDHYQQQRFSSMGDSILERMDTVGRKMEGLERDVEALLEQSGLDRPAAAAHKPSSSSMLLPGRKDPPEKHTLVEI